MNPSSFTPLVTRKEKSLKRVACLRRQAVMHALFVAFLADTINTTDPNT